jgi:hypothetical protein
MQRKNTPIHPKKKNSKVTLHNTSIGFYLDLEFYPSLKGKISNRFSLFFEKYSHKVLFHDQEIYKVCLSKLIEVLKILLKFTCSDIIDNSKLNEFEERFEMYNLEDDLSNINVKTRRASMTGSSENNVNKEFSLNPCRGKS